MYYQEICHNGFWFYRTSPNGKWKKFTAKMLCDKIVNLQKQIEELAKN